MTPPRVPTEADFEPLKATLPIALHFPSPPESTTTILILFHGLGDHEPPFAGFARDLALPGVLAVSVRGTAPLPASLLPSDLVDRHFHWGDDLTLDPATGDIDVDPGFEKAARLVMDRLVRETLIEKCGWETSDILFFGFGQGGSLALGLASRLRTPERITEISKSVGSATPLGNSFKGIVSIGGPLPSSMTPTLSSRDKSGTSVLVCQLEEDDVDAVKKEFKDVEIVNWKRKGVGMPQNRDEVLPIMKFFADKLNQVGGDGI